MKEKIGIMQGRLSPMIDGKIQSFPVNTWQEEFKIAVCNDFHLMEWTLDYSYFYENPFFSWIEGGEIAKLVSNHEFQIPSLTCDFMMEQPFWKMKNQNKISKLADDFLKVCESAARVGVKILVVPLVDNGSLKLDIEARNLYDFLSLHKPLLTRKAIRIAFESDFEPEKLKSFIAKFDSKIFGVNYDIGNSASLGFDVAEEFNCYGDRIVNIHVKDRVLNGGTISFGKGNANFEKVFLWLKKIGYQGNYILQGARASDGDHIGEIKTQRDFVTKFL